MITRRSFVSGLAGAAIIGPSRLLTASSCPGVGGQPLLTVGALSDLHVRLAPGGERLQDTYTTTTLVRALEWFRDSGVDAVIFAGDITDSGLAGELMAVADAWFKVFPADKAPDGRHVERVFVTGNHDWADSPRAVKVFADDERRRKDILMFNPAKWWDAAFHEEWKPHFVKSVKGFPFVGVHWSCREHGCTGHDELFTRGLEEFYDSIKPSIDPSRPFFHVQHPIPKGTAHGDEAWGQDDGVSTRILSAFPNAIAFSGHSHMSLTDERYIWQGEFTSVGCASLRDVTLSAPGLLKPKGGFENGKTPKGSFDKYDAIKAMGVFDRTECRQGQIVRIYPDRAVFTRREFMTDSSLGEDLSMPLPLAEGKPFAFKPRREKAVAPEFRKDAELVVERVKGRLRGNGKDKPPKADVWQLTIPPADAVASARAAVYEIKAVAAEGKDQVFGMQIPGMRFPLSDPRVHAPCVFRVACERVPQTGFEFQVRAISCWGKKSSPLLYDIRKDAVAKA